MPSYKNKERGTWFCAFYYTDWQGKRKKKKKEGFATKREAQEWERKFLEQYAGTPDLLFESLVEAYINHNKTLQKESTQQMQARVIKTHILPFFEGMPVNKITRHTVSKFRSELAGKNLSASYYRTIFRQLSTLLNFAIQFYNLPANPCSKTGKLPQSENHVDFWTIDEFRQFAIHIKRPDYIMLYYVLFWTGMRIGEALALTWEDINLDKNELSINKTFYAKRKIITPPKTTASVRTISLPQFIVVMLRDYKRMTKYCGQFIFNIDYSAVSAHMRYTINKLGLKRIRVHGLRHSHASLLIDAGFSPVDVAARLGHANATMTLKIYSHFYDNKQSLIAERLNSMN